MAASTSAKPNGSASSPASPTVVPFFINGQDVLSDRTFPVVHPGTGAVAHHYAGATTTDALAAIDAAKAAFPGWAASTPKTRRDILLKAADVMDRRRDELVGYMQSETGAAANWAALNIQTSADFLRDAAGRAASANVGTAPPTQDPDVAALVLNEPYGVVLALAPWNAPYILGIRSVIFPIAAGNTVVLKGTELAPRVMWAIASVLAEAGLPAGVLNVVYADAQQDAAAVTETLIAHPAVRKINFTGSTAVGRIIGRLAGENGKPVLLELGGKAPAIVWDDADLQLAADQCALGAFLNAGQICMSTERIIVQRRAAAEFETKLGASIDKFFGGSEAEAPLLVRPQAVDKAKDLVADAVAKGGRLAVGALDNAAKTSTARMRPVVVAGVTPAMAIYKTETFGPSVSLFVVDTEDEALALANDTEYGLSSAVFTEDLRRGLRLARGIEAGAVHINGMTVHDETALPHGGVKASGFGRFNGGLTEWVRTKTVTYRV